MIDIEGLIGLVGSINEPNRHVDDLIFQCVFGRKRYMASFEQVDPSERLPEYTKNVSDALTFVPSHVTWDVSRGEDGVFRAHVGNYGTMGTFNAAIALCIAALRWRHGTIGVVVQSE